MNIDHISVSRYGTYKDCQQKYKFRYHDKVEASEPTQPYFTYGKLIHKIIEEYTLGKGQRDLNEIRQKCLDGEILLEDKQDEAPRKVLPQEYLNKLPNHLKSFMKLANKIGTDGTCEWKFNFDLDPPNNKCVYGFIDRLIEKDGKYIIIDYKTTKKGSFRKSKKNVVTDLQLQCYSLVVMNEFNVYPSNIFAALYYLEGEEFIGARFSRSTLEKAQKTLLDVYNEIEAKDAKDARGRVGQHCYRCEYKSLCPFFSLT